MEKTEEIELKTIDHVFISGDKVYCSFKLAGRNYGEGNNKKPYFVECLENLVGRGLKEGIDVIRIEALKDFKKFGEEYKISCSSYDCENCGIRAHVIRKLNTKPVIKKEPETHCGEESST